jgi:small subunit ribosomal protein S4
VTKIVKSKYKICRRLGASLWGSAKDPVQKRNYPPGQHGLLGQKRKTVHGIQLQAKQKLKGYYNMTEKQFKNLYLKASNQKGNVTENLIALLERRLDAIVFRMNLAPTIFSARQLVSHKHILVNGKKVNIPSYSVKINDVIELTTKSQQMVLCIDSVQKMDRPVPSYLSFDSKKMQGSFVNIPLLSDVPYATVMEPHLVVEFYSK